MVTNHFPDVQIRCFQLATCRNSAIFDLCVFWKEMNTTKKYQKTIESRLNMMCLFVSLVGKTSKNTHRTDPVEIWKIGQVEKIPASQLFWHSAGLFPAENWVAWKPCARRDLRQECPQLSYESSKKLQRIDWSLGFHKSNYSEIIHLNGVFDEIFHHP